MSPVKKYKIKVEIEAELEAPSEPIAKAVALQGVSLQINLLSLQPSIKVNAKEISGLVYMDGVKHGTA